jgi:hypothetical protein
MKAPFLKSSFDEQSITRKSAWLVLTVFTFLVFFYSGTVLMSIMYPLDEALLAF